MAICGNILRASDTEGVKMLKIGQSAGKSYAYLLGVFLGDGCVTKANGYPAFRLNTIDEDFANATMEALRVFTDRPVSCCKHDVKKSSKPNYAVRCGDPDICRNLQEVTQEKAIIPPFVFEWPRELRAKFVEGLMDSEGYVAENRRHKTACSRYFMGFKSCDAWVEDFHKILVGLGVRTGKVSTEKPRKPWYKVPRRFYIKMQSWVDSGLRFNIGRKQEKVDEWAAHPAYTQRARNPRRLPSETTRHASA